METRGASDGRRGEGSAVAGVRGRWCARGERQASAPRPLGVLLALLPLVLFVVLSSVFLSRWERELDAANRSIAEKGGPSVVHLSAEQADLRHIEMQAMLARPESLREDRAKIAALEADLERADAAYRKTDGLPGRARGLRAGAGGSRALLRRGRPPARRHGGRPAAERGGARRRRLDRRRALRLLAGAHPRSTRTRSCARTPPPAACGAAPCGSPTSARWPSPSSSARRCWASGPPAARPRSPRSAAASTSSASTISTPSRAASPTTSGTCSGSS